MKKILNSAEIFFEKRDDKQLNELNKKEQNKLLEIYNKLLENIDDKQLNEFKNNKNELFEIYNDELLEEKDNNKLSLDEIKENSKKIFLKYDIQINLDDILNDIKNYEDLTIKQLEEKVKEIMSDKKLGGSRKKRKTHKKRKGGKKRKGCKKRKTHKKRKSYKKKILYGGNHRNFQCDFCFGYPTLSPSNYTKCGHGPYHISCLRRWFESRYNNYYYRGGDKPECIVCGSYFPLNATQQYELQVGVAKMRRYDYYDLQEMMKDDNNDIRERLAEMYPDIPQYALSQTGQWQEGENAMLGILTFMAIVLTLMIAIAAFNMDNENL
jgi:hypothetical protein